MTILGKTHLEEAWLAKESNRGKPSKEEITLRWRDSAKKDTEMLESNTKYSLAGISRRS